MADSYATTRGAIAARKQVVETYGGHRRTDPSFSRPSTCLDEVDLEAASPES